ncbi:MAG: DUF2905 domain-containing protein [Calditerrivibrio sp.]|nr:DUF2905 domain-containing protein [Calditerrivibrio sp.]MCA1932252.1 DUF2905 domain-containing protein [Calditerrivibrio sp.]MCA1980514.1 DUF2905 domain-containing protein [Calditerrivibrio sp.]
MDNFGGIGKLLIVSGVILILAGLFFTLFPKLGIGRLPGDIFYKKGNFTFHFPIVSSIIISIVLTLLLNIFFRK